MDRAMDVGIARHVDHEVDLRASDQLANVGDDADVAIARELEAGSPGVHVGDAEDRDGRIAGEHFEERATAFTGADDEPWSHRRAYPPGERAAEAARTAAGSAD